MKIRPQIKTLEESGLVRLAHPKPDLEYLFRHALVHEAAYASILKTEQRRIHQLVGETLEQLYPDRLEELAPELGRHFDEAGAYPEALKYLKLAGDLAARRYALQEAVEHYTLAIEAAKKSGAPLAGLLRLRGSVYETMGEFEKARMDRESILLFARSQGLLSEEWSALLDLGALWAGQDYQETGRYYRQAYDLAQANGNSVMLARALNHLGNWHLNMDETDQARQFHHQALEVFEKIPDQAGTAETLDLLGMAYFLSGDLMTGKSYLNKAIDLFRQSDNPRLLTSSLASISMCTAVQQTDTLVFAELSENCIQTAEESLALAQKTGNRSGEAFALFVLSQLRSYRGEYGFALDTIRASIRISEEIQHRQWTCSGYFAQGCWYFSILSFATALRSFEKALALAKELGSKHWQRSAGGMTVRSLIALGSLNEAEKLLADMEVDQNAVVSMSARLVQLSEVELALAHHDPERALGVLDQMKRQTPHLIESGEQTAIGLCYPRARALIELQRNEESLVLLNSVFDQVVQVGAGSMEWRIHSLKACVCNKLSRLSEAEEEIRLCREKFKHLAASILDEQDRQAFIRSAEKELACASE